MHEPRCLGARRIWICDDAFKRVSAETRIDAPTKLNSRFIAAFINSSSDLPKRGWRTNYRARACGI